MHTTLSGGHRSVSVGGNGSGSVLAALLFAGYSVAGRPESSRVRGRWVTSVPDLYQSHEASSVPDGMPRVDVARRSVTAMRELVAFNAPDWSGTQATWVYCEDSTIARGLALKPVKDPVLAAICTYWDHCANDPKLGAFTPDEVVALAEALRTVLAFLDSSCWYETVKAVTELFELAAAEHAEVRHG